MSTSTYAGLSGRVALVTGGARGLGRATVLRLVDSGCSVAACDIDRDGLRTLDGLPTGSGRIATFVVDLADADACDKLVNDVRDQVGPVEILVNNAAILGRRPRDEVTVPEFDRVIAVNLRAPYLLSRAVLADMEAAKWGRIINIASIAVRTGGSSDLFAYAASKGGLVALTKALARSAANAGVLVSAVLPAGIDTQMITDGLSPEALEEIRMAIPLRRFASPEEMCEVILWLASDSASYVTGASFDVNGGWAMT